MVRYCTDPDCVRPVFRGDFCGTCLKRRQRGSQRRGEVLKPLPPGERVLLAASDWVEADDDFDAKRRAVLRACEDWMASMGWTPPNEGTTT